jgi:hypothetical protein
LQNDVTRLSIRPCIFTETNKQIMKKIIATGILSIVLLSACKNETPTAFAEPATMSTPTPSAPEVVPVPEVKAEDGTSVKTGSDVLSVDHKDGKNKTNVEINNGGAGVEIKK